MSCPRTIRAMVAAAGLAMAFTAAGPGGVRAGAGTRRLDVPQPPASSSMQVRGRAFVDASGRPFSWRGVTAFALLDQVADGREADAVAFMRWARQRGFTLVRVLGMAHLLFRLSPDAGLRALPRLLGLAAAEGLAIELVIFADTREFPDLDLLGHAAAVGRAAHGAPNLVIELANENTHHTQDRRISDPAFLRALRDRLPKAFAVSLGSLHGGDVRIDRYPGGDYVTLHVSRSGNPWDNVSRVAEVARLSEQVGMPVVSDEPIGAGERNERSRRLSDPSVFFGLGVVGRMAGVPTTFHCEDCLLSRRPRKGQDACAAAFMEGSRLLPESVRFSLSSEYSKGAAGPLARGDVAGAGEILVASDQGGEQVFIAVVGGAGQVAIPWRQGWSGKSIASKPGINVYRASRVTPGQFAIWRPSD